MFLIYICRAENAFVSDGSDKLKKKCSSSVRLERLLQAEHKGYQIAHERRILMNRTNIVGRLSAESAVS
jgi:hypothetical protein